MENNNSLSLLSEQRGADFYVESSAEYILPDYNADVRKLLYTSCDVKSAGKFSADEQIDFSGIVEYRVIYADKDGEISEVAFTSDYEYSLPLSGDIIDAESTPSVQNYQIRVLGPRKIAAKASLACENIYTSERQIGCEGLSEGNIETERRTVSVGRVKKVESEEREIAEEISRLDGVTLDEVTLISAIAECCEVDFTRSGDDGVCKSEVKVKLLYRDNEGGVIPLEAALSAEGVIPLSGVPESASVICTPVILSERCECVPTDDGINIVANLILKWEGVCIYNEEHSVITDGYSTEHMTENKYSSLGIISYMPTVSEVVIKEGAVMPECAEGGRIKEVLLTGARARITEKRLDGGECNISFEARVQGVVAMCTSDDKVIYTPLKITENIAKKVNLSSKKCTNFGANVKILSCNVLQKIDGEEIKYQIKLVLSILPFCEENQRILSDISLDDGEEFEKVLGRVTVYYTEPGDSLFSIAKKYHTTKDKLLENNEIVAEVIGGEEHIRLPRKLIIY